MREDHLIAVAGIGRQAELSEGESIGAAWRARHAGARTDAVDPAAGAEASDHGQEGQSSDEQASRRAEEREAGEVRKVAALEHHEADQVLLAGRSSIGPSPNRGWTTSK